MRKMFMSALVLGLSGALLGCPPSETAPVATNGETQTTEGGEATDATPADEPAEKEEEKEKSTGIDVSHVKAGQKYTIVMNHGMEMTSIWEIKEVSAEAIKYAMTNIMNDAPVGPPHETEFPLTSAAPADTGAAVEAPPSVGEETITVGGIDFKCTITESDGVKSWTAMQFPGLIKQTKGDTVTHLLKSID